jgi:hypothetical protein
VDSPCSGENLDRRVVPGCNLDRPPPLNRRWLFVCASLCRPAACANLARVGLLVLTGRVFGWRLLAQMLRAVWGDWFASSPLCRLKLPVLLSRHTLKFALWLSLVLILAFIGMVWFSRVCSPWLQLARSGRSHPAANDCLAALHRWLTG